MPIGWMLISALGAASLFAWLILGFFRGWFWLPGPWLERSCSDTSSGRTPNLPAIWPDVHVIVPARNEANVLEETISALRVQRYPGGMTLTVVDDQSTDATHDLLARLAEDPGERILSPANRPHRKLVPLFVVRGRSLPAGLQGLLSLRHAGYMAGLGVFGKNTLLTNDTFGNRIVLGAALLNIGIKPDDLAEYDFCPPDCRICIKNCPAGALDGKTVVQKLCRAESQGHTKKGDYLYICNNCRKLCPNGRGYGMTG